MSEESSSWNNLSKQTYHSKVFKLTPLIYTSILLQFLQDHGTVMSQIVTEMDHAGTTTVMTEEETATGIAMMTGTAETMIEEVCYSALVGPLVGSEIHLAVSAVVWLPESVL